MIWPKAKIISTNGISLGQATPGDGMRAYAIGDVHGCHAEMTIMLDLIADDLRDNPIADYRIIFLGDYCDRGPDVRSVIDTLMERQKTDRRVICLLGNHDDKLRKAQNVLDPHGFAVFLRYGGTTTLASYGADADELRSLEVDGSKQAREKVRDIVCDVVPKEHLAFIENRPRWTSLGDYFFCHGGVRPGTDLDEQDAEDLIWIREPFLSHEAPFEKVVIHGHTRQQRVDIRTNRINVDTSCCYGGALSCVVLQDTNHRFLQVPAQRQHWLAS